MKMSSEKLSCSKGACEFGLILFISFAHIHVMKIVYFLLISCFILMSLMDLAIK